MRVFVTGASGYIGSAIVTELLGAGHEVVGLARSDASAAALTSAGAEVHRGALDDLDSLRAGAAACEGVIHTAYVHDFSNLAASGPIDQRAVATLGEALEGSGRPLVVTSATAVLATAGRAGTEEDAPDKSSAGVHRIASEEITLALAPRGVRSCVLRLPPSVHGEGDRIGFVPNVIRTARDKGVSAYVGDGSNRWPAVHRLDAARLYRLALESAPAASVLHATGEEGVAVSAIAEVIGRHLALPVQAVAPQDAGAHFGWLAGFLSADVPASSAITRELLGWEPTHPGLIDDLEVGHYFG